jgi:hypothetical protein
MIRVDFEGIAIHNADVGAVPASVEKFAKGAWKDNRVRIDGGEKRRPAAAKREIVTNACATFQFVG